MNQTMQTILTNLKQRWIFEGGFEESPGGGYRPDATAWSILALSAIDAESELVEQARLSLEKTQLSDGRIPLFPGHTDACWPTPLAVLAWANSLAFEQAHNRAISFLLDFTGVHGERTSNSPLAHNTALKGWPWIAGTHSWVEPTALSILALRSVSRQNHPRVSEAIAMLLDRQLPTGGWNYGNTQVYGQHLRPMPDTTGLALLALAGLVEGKKVERSIDYLSDTIPGIASPLSLSWGLLGLKAWHFPKKAAGELICRSLDRRSLYGDFSTTQLCLLLLAHPNVAESSIFRYMEDKN